MHHRRLAAAYACWSCCPPSPLYKVVKTEYVPSNVDEAEFEVSVTAPEGTSLAAMDEAMRTVEAELRQVPAVRTMLASTGGGFIGSVNQATLFVRIAPHEERRSSVTRLPVAAWCGSIRSPRSAATTRSAMS